MSRIPAPVGRLLLPAGLIGGGAAGYAFLALFGRALGPQQFADLSILWTVVNVIGPGVFSPIEQELTRALSERAGRGEGGLPIYLAARRITLIGTTVTVVALLAASPLLLGPLFDSHVSLLLATVAATVYLAAANLSRGVFAAAGRLSLYGGQLLVEAVVRVAFAATALAVGVRSVGFPAVAIVVAGALAVVLTFRGAAQFDRASGAGGLLSRAGGPPAGSRELSGRLWILLGTSLVSYTLLNAGPIIVKLLAAPGDSAAAGVFLSGLQVARVPLFAFAAVSVVMLPALSRAYAAGDLAGFRSSLRRIVAAVVALGLASTAGAGLIGPFVVRVFFGRAFDLGRLDLTLLSAGAASYMVALALGQGLLALDRHASVLAGWCVGAGVLVVVTAIVGGLERRVEAGFLLGSAAAVLAMGVLIARTPALRTSARLTAPGLRRP